MSLLHVDITTCVVGDFSAVSGSCSKKYLYADPFQADVGNSVFVLGHTCSVTLINRGKPPALPEVGDSLPPLPILSAYSASFPIAHHQDFARLSLLRPLCPPPP